MVFNRRIVLDSNRQRWRITFLLAADPNISVTDAFFESFSALTTTGRP